MAALRRRVPGARAARGHVLVSSRGARGGPGMAGATRRGGRGGGRRGTDGRGARGLRRGRRRDDQPGARGADGQGPRAQVGEVGEVLRLSRSANPSITRPTAGAVGSRWPPSLRITFLCPHLRISGGVRAILTYANRLAARDHDVEVVVPARGVLKAAWRRWRGE